MIGVTAEEHAARAAELVGEAERLYQICLVDYQTNINVDDRDLRSVPVVRAAGLEPTIATQIPC
ncbi:hypothetical protein M1L60_45150 [Actinoplanes sp. TRM 88003]|uniref:Uncharacterized protein n=1 Tax=Paractinoplanes aksuensis TaxID=2939490 RepID=A0ABT1E4I4_9ACTN|nr:hypothetical protein [Actinoplanes aksuensis]MCO8277783.1 hypothetical protein [Actinoplanes aksuensis]